MAGQISRYRIFFFLNHQSAKASWIYHVGSGPFLSRLAYLFLIESIVLGLACRIISIQESLTLLILVLAAYNQFQTQSGFYESIEYRVASSCTSQSSTYLFGGCTFLVLFISHCERSDLLVFSEILKVDLTAFSWLRKQKYLFFFNFLKKFSSMNISHYRG